MACSAHVEKGDTVAVSVAVEKQQGPDGGWGIAMTRGTVLQGSQTGTNLYLCLYSADNLVDLCFYTWHCNKKITQPE